MDSPPFTSVSVVIVNYNVRYLLEQCLHSLRRSGSELSLQLIVVDNASGDGSVSYLKERFPEVSFISLEANVGYASANNIGLSHCTGEFILILNPDTVLSEDTLPRLIQFLRANPSCGLVTPKLIRKDGALDLACHRSLPTPWVAFSRISGLSRLFPKTRIFGRYNLSYLDDNAPVQVGAMTGAFMLMPAEVYRKVGGFDERFFMYGEDLDYCARVKEAGYELHYRPETTAVHYRGESTRRSGVDKTDAFYGAMIRYAQKHYRGWARGYGLLLLHTGIILAKWGVRLWGLLGSIWPMMVDAFFVALAINIGHALRWGAPLNLLTDSRVLLVDVILVVLSLAAVGAYSVTDRQLPKAALKGAVLAGFVSGTYTFFLLQNIMFSRMVVLISAIFWSLFLPGWRQLILILQGMNWTRRLMRRTAIIVGTDDMAKLIGERLLSGQDEYELAGFVRYRNKDVDSNFGYDPLGTSDELERIVVTEHVSDVFFSTGGASYAEIVAMANRLAPFGVHYKVLSAEAPGSALPLFGVDWQTPMGWRGFWRGLQRRWGK